MMRSCLLWSAVAVTGAVLRCLMRRVSLVLFVVLFGLGTTMSQGTNAQEATPSAGPVEFLWETGGGPDTPLGNPSHLAVAPDGNIWVVDGDNDRFQIFAPD